MGTAYQGQGSLSIPNASAGQADFKYPRAEVVAENQQESSSCHRFATNLFAKSRMHPVRRGNPVNPGHPAGMYSVLLDET